MRLATPKLIKRCFRAFCLSGLFQIFFFHIVVAQSPAIEWQHCYGGPGGDYSFGISPTKDGGYIMSGHTEGNGGDVKGYHGNPTLNDIWVMKTDKDGNLQWQRCIGTFSVEFSFPSGIQQTNDGGYVLAGSSDYNNCEFSGVHNSIDFMIIKLDSAGNVLWNKSYGGSKNDYAQAMAATPDGGYIIAGNTESSDGDLTANNGGLDGWMIKVDGSGNLLWQKNFGGSKDDEFWGASVTADGNYLATGYTYSNDGDITLNKGDRDFYIVELSPSGNVIWQKNYGGSAAEIAYSIKGTPDGGSIVVGLTGSNDKDVSGNHQPIGPDADFWSVKLDKNGVLQWQKCYGGELNEVAYSVELTKDGGYLIGGSAESPDGEVGCNYGLTDCWMIKTDGQGNLLWHKNVGGSYYDELHDIKSLADGSIIFTGYNCSTEINGYHPVTVENGTCADFLVVKLAPQNLHQKTQVKIQGSPLICNTEVKLYANAKFAGIKYKYNWFKNGVNLGINSSVYNGSGLAAGDKIVCTVTTTDECDDVSAGFASDTVILKNNTNIINPSITIKADNTAVCNCDAVSFTASVTDASKKPAYEWFVNDISTGYIQKTFSSKILEPNDLVKCVYTSNDACILNNSAVSNVIQITGATSVVPLASITTASNNICKGSSVTFKAAVINAGANPSFQWMINNANVGSNSNSLTTSALQNNDMVKCMITTDPSFACASSNTATSNTITMQVTNKVVPTVAIATPSAVICSGNAITFHAASLNAGNEPVFQWMVNGINTGANDSVFTTSSLKDKDTVSCTIQVDPSFTCANASSATSNKIIVTVNNGAASTVSITGSSNDVCYGTTLTFNADAENAGSSVHYQWQLNNSAVGNDAATYSDNNFMNGDSVTCIITPGANACAQNAVTSNTIILQINPLPVISISPSDTFVKAGDVVQFKTTVTANVQSFLWQPVNQLQNSLVLSPITVPLTNDQTYSLTVTSNKGCSTTQNAIVRINYPFNMPNAFTPNRDGINDMYRIPPHTNITLKEFSIYNRWGEKIFTSTDISKGWDGTLNGNPVPSGSFIYVVNGFDANGRISVKGTFTLIR